MIDTITTIILAAFAGIDFAVAYYSDKQGDTLAAAFNLGWGVFVSIGAIVVGVRSVING